MAKVIEKHKPHIPKDPVDINDINVDELSVSNKYMGLRCFKYLVVYLNHSKDNIKPLPIKPPKLNWSIKNEIKSDFYS